MHIPQHRKLKNVAQVGEVVLNDWVLQEVEGDAADQRWLLDQWLQLHPEHSIHLKIPNAGAKALDANLDVAIACIALDQQSCKVKWKQTREA